MLGVIFKVNGELKENKKKCIYYVIMDSVFCDAWMCTVVDLYLPEARIIRLLANGFFDFDCDW